MTQGNKFRNSRNYTRPPKNKFSSEQENIWPKIITKCVGLILPIFVIFLVVAFFSYIFSYDEDQIIVESYLKSFPLDPAVKIKNLGGLYGAVLAYIFIYKYFGFISSLIILFLIFFGGIRLARLKYFSRWDGWKILFLSLFLIFIVNSSIGIFRLGNFSDGNFSGFLSTVLGKIMFQLLGFGAYFIILVLIVAFLFFVFKSRFPKKIIKQEIEVAKDNVASEEGNEDIVAAEEK
ncbi:MAG: DNA translocase FtsK 4TM domain-containing protein [Cytophagales bacterium]|jgi:S-DNA-T family DNA segregation ATPase FtsK/SpoIIIE|nr:DNA translocase FtsK 4TM domain-containing protein [Cytophagales bacterium]